MTVVYCSTKTQKQLLEEKKEKIENKTYNTNMKKLIEI